MPYRTLPLLSAALLAAFPAWGNETTLSPVHVQADKDDFEARQTATSTKLVYGREELDRMNELTVGDYPNESAPDAQVTTTACRNSWQHFPGARHVRAGLDHYRHYGKR